MTTIARSHLALHQTKNDLPERTRSALADILNRRLADAIDLQLQAKQAHWNVRGPSFIALHELFDNLRFQPFAQFGARLGGEVRIQLQ